MEMQTLLAEADAELLRRLMQIRDLEEENAHLHSRLAATVAMLHDADEKREWWRSQFVETMDRLRIEEEM